MAIHMMAPGWTKENPVMTTSYEGCVLDTYERNGYNDSDFYAIVWVAAHVHKWEQGPTGFKCVICNAYHSASEKNPPEERTTGSIKHVEYASTRGWCEPNHAKADATPEVIAAAKASFLPHVRSVIKARHEKEAHKIRMGDVVVNARGRKLPKGLQGLVVWMGQDKFTGEERIGLENSEGRFYAAAKNFDVVGWERRMASSEAIEKQAQEVVARYDVRSLGYYGVYG